MNENKTENTENITKPKRRAVAPKECVCAHCGKTFMTPSGHARKYCSEECRKLGTRAYMTKFQADRRAKMDQAGLDANRKLARESWARKTWKIWGERAETIIKLAQGPNAKATLTKYLCDNYRPRTKKQTPPDLSSIAEASDAAKIIAESLGDN